MPFADQAARVSGIAKHFGQRREFVQRATRIRARLQSSARQERMDAMLRRDQSGQQRRPRRRTNRIGRKRASEQRPFGRQSIDVRRPNVGIAVTTQRPSPVIVGHDQHDVGAIVRRCAMTLFKTINEANARHASNLFTMPTP